MPPLGNASALCQPHATSLLGNMAHVAAHIPEVALPLLQEEPWKELNFCDSSDDRGETGRRNEWLLKQLLRETVLFNLSCVQEFISTMLPFNGLLFTRSGHTHRLLTRILNRDKNVIANMGLEKRFTELRVLIALLKDLDFVFRIHMETANCLHMMP